MDPRLHDRRDVSPTSAVDDLAELPAERLATVCGRYYAMDRDARPGSAPIALPRVFVGGPETGDAVQAVREATRGVSRTSSSRPVAVRGRPRLLPALDSDLLQLPP